MARLIHTAITSLDGYIADENGDFGWAAPDPEVHAFVNELERPVGTYLYGRRLYETMVYWETASQGPQVERDYAELWRAADKIVYSTTLTTVGSARTRIEPAFDPDTVRELKKATQRDLSIGGAELAAHALRAGLVDEIRLLVNPVIVGAGRPALPGRLRAKLRLSDQRRFAGGVVYLSYEVAS
nr:dihydrofolate reductase family protein [uncultured Actinoplanes sp.]